MFIGRKQELEELNQLYEKNNYQCVILYGRRRVGKTTLITEFMKGKRGVFYVAQENTPKVSLIDFSEKVFQSLGIEQYQSGFSDWEKAFSFLGTQALEKQLIVAIDEFPYLAKANSELKSVLQNVIDHMLKDTKLFLILCGSQVSFMEKEVMGYSSPLYGRRTAQMRLEPFSFFESRDFFTRYTVREQMEAYFILGGVPLYLAQFDDRVTIEENIKQNILKKYSYLYEEPKNLLKQELREPMVYNAVIEAIAEGASGMNEIALKAGINPEHSSRYLSILIELLLIEKELPLGEPLSSRKGIYRLRDTFFLFWYRFVFRNVSELEAGSVDEVYEEEVKPILAEFYGHCFEAVCSQLFRRQNQTKKLPYRFSKLGRWWGNNPKMKRQEEIDLYAVGKEGIYLGECKWRNQLSGIEILKKLEEKAGLFHSDRITYVFYSKSGYTEEMKQEAGKREDIILYSIEDFL